MWLPCGTTLPQSVRLPDLQCHSADVAQLGTATDRRSQGWDAQRQSSEQGLSNCLSYLTYLVMLQVRDIFPTGNHGKSKTQIFGKNIHAHLKMMDVDVQFTRLLLRRLPCSSEDQSDLSIVCSTRLNSD